MIEFNPRLVFFVLFVLGLAVFLYWDRDKISRHYILFYRRTKRGIVMIDRIAKRAPRFWNYYGWGAVIAGFVSIVASIGLVGYTFFRIFFRSPSVSQGVEDSGFSLIAPGIVSEPQIQAGVSFIPVEYWVISIGIIMVVHELSHGIVARANDFEINSVGWIILGVIPGAFVEPKGENMLPGDEENQDDSTGMWEQGTWTGRLKVLGAGSFANYITAGVFFLLLTGFTASIANPSDVFYQTEEEFPAYDSGMRNGTLVEINGERIGDISDLQRVSGNISVGDNVTVWSSEGNYTIQAVERENYDGGYIGIRVGQSQVVKEKYQGFAGPLLWTQSLFQMIAFLNLMIGLFNMLPFKPLDGGLMVETVLKKYREGWVEYLNRFSLLGWSLILATMITALLI